MAVTFNKIQVLRSQLDGAILLVSLEDGIVAAHTIIMAAEELFRSIYVKKDLFVEFDYRFYIKDEYQIRYLQKLREKYNFFKHADRDTDATLDVDPEQIHRFNELTLGLLIVGCRKTFSKSSKAMDTYGKWFSVIYHDYIKWENIPGGNKLKEKLVKQSRDDAQSRQMLRVMLYHDGALPRDDFDFLQILDSNVIQKS